MINKKIILGLFVFSFLGACATPTAMLGPAYTLSSTGSAYHAGLTYGSTEIITLYTGKTPIENLQEITLKKKEETKNIKKNTLESEDFLILVQQKIKKNRSIIKLTSQ
tara:strand:+ start:595 stop:918 length:324 start_codon:yes stop_codon:yes gene_type:complete